MKGLVFIVVIGGAILGAFFILSAKKKKDEINPNGLPPTNDPPVSNRGTISGAFDFIEQVSAGGCEAVVRNKIGVDNALLGKGCSIWHKYFTPTGYASLAWDYKGAAANAASTGIHATTNAVGTAANAVGSAAKTVYKTITPWNW